MATTAETTRGHTGRARVADRSTTLIYAIVLLAALARVRAPFHAEWSPALLGVSANLWSVAWLLFTNTMIIALSARPPF